MGTFLKKAEELELDVQNLKNKKSFNTPIIVDSIDKLKTLFSVEMIPVAQGAPVSTTPLTIAEKLYDDVFLNAPLTEKESVQLEHAMP